MTDNTRKLLDAAAAVLGLPPGLPPIGERRRVLDEVHEVVGYDRYTNGETWVCWRNEAGVRGMAQPMHWHTRPLDAQPESAPDTPRGEAIRKQCAEHGLPSWLADVCETHPDVLEVRIVRQDGTAHVYPFTPALRVVGLHDVLPRVVEWADLQPGDLALDAGE